MGQEVFPNEPAWKFPLNKVLGIFICEDFAIEDLFFIYAFTNLFYWFAWAIRKVPDSLSRSKNKIFYNGLMIAFNVIILGWLYQTGGEGAKVLITCYIMLPALVFGQILNHNNYKYNFTQLYILFAFVCFCSIGWEFVDKFWLKCWYYNPNCELLSKEGFFLKGKFHTSITIGYTIAGFVFFAGPYYYYDMEEKKKKGLI